MRLERQAGLWLIVLLAVAAVLYLLGNILMPFAVGLALAYLLHPLADRLEALGLSRLSATIFILAMFVLGIVVILILIAPVLARQFSGFIQNLPDYVARLQGLVTNESARLVAKYGGGGFWEKLGFGAGPQPADLQKTITDIAGQSAQWLGGFLGSLWSGGQALIGLFSLLVLAPVVAFYILLDWHKMVAALKSWVPPRYRVTVHALAKEIDHAIAGFFRGQSLVCLVIGLWYGIGLSLIGLNFGLLIGISAGVLTFIPYVGSLTALIISSGVAIVQGWPDWKLLVMSLAVVLTGQFLEGNVLSPRLVGRSVGLHPVWIMFALFSFGSLFGFTGLIVAVPLAAAAGVLLRFGLRRYLASPLFLDTEVEEVASAQITDARADERRPA
jgi:predicted PurR-regulated permease PerM